MRFFFSLMFLDVCHLLLNSHFTLTFDYEQINSKINILKLMDHTHLLI